MGKHLEHTFGIRVKREAGEVAEHCHAGDADHGRAREELAALGFRIVFLINLRGQGNGTGGQGGHEHGANDEHGGILRQCHDEVTGTAQTGQYGGGMRGVPAAVFDEGDDQGAGQ